MTVRGRLVAAGSTYSWPRPWSEVAWQSLNILVQQMPRHTTTSNCQRRYCHRTRPLRLMVAASATQRLEVLIIVQATRNHGWLPTAFCYTMDLMNLVKSDSRTTLLNRSAVTRSAAHPQRRPRSAAYHSTITRSTVTRSTVTRSTMSLKLATAMLKGEVRLPRS
jgi:hypothetical protein